MNRLYLISTLRNLWKYRGYYLIDSFGLGLSLSLFTLINLWVDHERSYDRFHDNGEDIFQLYEQSDRGFTSSIPLPLSDHLVDEIPEVKDYCALGSSGDRWIHNKEKISKAKVITTDPSFFEIFSWKLTVKDSNFFSTHRSVVISDRLSQELFGEKNSIGISVDIETNGKKITHLVTGVFKKPPRNSSLQFDAVIPLFRNFSTNRWKFKSRRLFLQVHHNSSTKQIENKLLSLHDKYGDVDHRVPKSVFLEPLTQTHLHNGPHDTTQLKIYDQVLIGAFVSLIILLVGVVNHTNIHLSIWNRENHFFIIKKRIGATDRIIFNELQFQTLLTTSLAAFICFVLLFFEIVLLKGSSELNFLFDTSYYQILKWVSFGSSLVLVVTSIINALLVFFQTSSFFSSIKKANQLLLVFQFAVCMVSSVFVYHGQRQINMLISKDKGINTSMVLVLDTKPYAYRELRSLIEELRQSNQIIKVCLSSSNGNRSMGSRFGQLNIDGENVWLNNEVSTMNVDPTFCDIYAPTVEEGYCHTEKSKSYFLVNRSFIRNTGLNEPIGKIINTANYSGPIAGVISDFQHLSLKEKTGSLLITVNKGLKAGSISISYQGSLTDVLQDIHDIHIKYSNKPIAYTILEDSFSQELASETNFLRLSNLAFLLILTITLMGAILLSVFNLENEKKNIAIRKVNGSTLWNEYMNLTKGFTIIVLLAFVLTLPISSYLISSWQSTFPIQVGFDWWFFILIGLTTYIIVMITIGFQTYRAAKADPVRSLKYE